MQINHCQGTQDLFSKTILEKNIDLAIISKPYRIHGDVIWVKDRTEEDFIKATMKGTHIYSCFVLPSPTLDEYKQMLSALVVDARGHWPIIIVGDFSAWALEWHSRTTNVGRMCSARDIAELDMVLASGGTRQST